MQSKKNYLRKQSMLASDNNWSLPIRCLTCQLIRCFCFTGRGFARILRLPALFAARRPLRVERHARLPYTWASIWTFEAEALILRNSTKVKAFQWCPTILACASLAVQALCAITTWSHGFRTARLAAIPRRKWLGRLASLALINNFDIGTIRPNLGQLFTLPSKAQNIVARWYFRHTN